MRPGSPIVSIWRSLLFLAIFLPSTTHSQDISDASLAPPASPSVLSISTRSVQTTLSKTISRPSMTTPFVTSSFPNTTVPSPTSATDDGPPQLFPDANSGHPDAQRQTRESVFNYYFLFLALFGVLVAIGLWWIQRRRRRRKEQMRLSGNNALARDLEGWVNTRRWMHGAWRHNQTAAFVRREEGLNEHGEAPPPYQPKSDVTVAHGASGAAQDATSGLTIPLRTLSRDNIEISRPPEYHETVNRGANANMRPDTATTRATRPDTGDAQPHSSTRDLLRNQRTRSST